MASVRPFHFFTLIGCEAHTQGDSLLTKGQGTACYAATVHFLVTHADSSGGGNVFTAVCLFFSARYL